MKDREQMGSRWGILFSKADPSTVPSPLRKPKLLQKGLSTEDLEVKYLRQGGVFLIWTMSVNYRSFTALLVENLLWVLLSFPLFHAQNHRSYNQFVIILSHFYFWGNKVGVHWIIIQISSFDTFMSIFINSNSIQF